MSHLGDEDHGPGLRLAQSEMGAVTMCPCGVVTVTLQYLSLRFEPGAFGSLVQLLAHAQARLDHGASQGGVRSTDVNDAEAGAPLAPSVH